MFDGTSRSDAGRPALERAQGRARLRFGATGLAELHQGGAYKVRLPRAAPPEAVLLNTAGGLAGGDRLSCEVRLDAGAAATVTSAACEKVYRSEGAAASVAVTMRLDAGAHLAWLPQETILFDGARLERRVEIDAAGDARLLVAEAVIFGRTARGEIVRSGAFRDSWRLRRAGRLVFADETRSAGAVAEQLARRAALAGGCAAATLIYVAGDAATRLAGLRTALDALEAEGGGSERDGVLVARLVAPDGFTLRPALVAAIAALRDAPLPTVWTC